MLWGAFAALGGGIAGNAIFKGGQELGRSALGQGVKRVGRNVTSKGGAAIRKGVDALRSTESFAYRSAKESAKVFDSSKFRTISEFSDTFTKKGAEKLAEHAPSFSNYFRPVKRTFADETLTGAAKKANNKEVRKSVNNLYLGFEMKKGYQAALAGVLIAGSAGSQIRQEVGDLAQNKNALVNTEYTGDLGRTQADMIGGVNQGRRDLGATGDIVLALNKRR